MPQRPTAPRSRARPQPPTRFTTPLSARSRAPHHRRRRALALVALVAVLLLAITGLPGGAAPARRISSDTDDYFGRIRLLAGVGPLSFAVLQQKAQTEAINRTLGYTPYVRLAGTQHREIALTFDDGPGPYTPEILATLGRYGVPGTFFEVGVLERYFHASTAQIVADGFTIGDHTQLHAPMSRLSEADQRTEILEQASVIARYGAAFPRLFRPPYGLWNSTTLALLRQYRMLMVLWTVDTSDYRRPGAQAIVQSALAGARPGAIILLHDAGGDRSETVAALPVIIANLRARGYRLVTVPQLLLDNPPPADQQVSALSGSGG